MKFTETKLKGVWTIDIEPSTDDRGFFARTVCVKEFAAHDLRSDFVQSSISHNHVKGTLRGMHYQAAPHEEAKLVRCTCGAIYDVVLDLRRGSPTFLRWLAVELTGDNQRAVYIPAGCAHGFQTLADGTDVFYQITEFFYPDCARGVRWDDPAFKIIWPVVQDRIMSIKDQEYQNFSI